MDDIIKHQRLGNQKFIDLLQQFNTHMDLLKTHSNKSYIIDKLRLINNSLETVQDNIYSILNELGSNTHFDDTIKDALELEKTTGENLKKVLPIMLYLFMSTSDSNSPP